MGLRKALAYSKKYARPYTRKSSVKSKAYIKTIPPQKIVKYKMGAISDYENKKLKIIIKLVSREGIMIRDNSLEASRQYVHKILEENLLGQYYFGVRVVPHHILREHKAAGGTAGADRISSGMTHSFGVAIGRAAMLKKGQEIFLVAVSSEKAKKIALKALETVKAKLPCHASIMLENLQ